MIKIKYRLIFDDEIVGYERWSKGSQRWEQSFEGKVWDFGNIIPHDAKDQYIGLKDNGGDLNAYENDIIEYYWGVFVAQDETELKKYRDVIIWNDRLCRYVLKEKGDVFEILISNDRLGEIIGNIHENSKLCQ